MVAIIEDGESGASVRGKLNAVIAAVDHFANDPDTTTGLTYGIKEGKIRAKGLNATGTQSFEAGTVELPDNADVQLWLCPGLVVGGNNYTEAVLVLEPGAPRPVGAYCLAGIETSGGEITDIGDLRAFATGAFESRGTLTDLSFVSIVPNGDDFDVTIAPGYVMGPIGSINDLGGTVTIPDDGWSNVYVEGETLTANQTDFPHGVVRLFEIELTAGVVTGFFDRRAFLSMPVEGLTTPATAVPLTTGASPVEASASVRLYEVTTGGTEGTEVITLPNISSSQIDRTGQRLSLVLNASFTHVSDVLAIQGLGASSTFPVWKTDGNFSADLSAIGEAYGGGSVISFIAERGTWSLDASACVWLSASPVVGGIVVAQGLPVAFSELQDAATCLGGRAFITDGATTLLLGIGIAAAGGGANKVPVYSDGTDWIYG